MRIVVGNDHGGYKAKTALIKFLKDNGYEVIDVGCYDENSCDYPDFAELACRKIISNEADFGVLICTSGEGISMAANKIHGIRCGIGYNDEVCELMRRHNHANVVAFGAKFMTNEEICKRTQIFLSSSIEEGRHSRRVEKINSLK